MIDKLLTFGAGFDWITPVYSLWLDWRRRPSVGYTVPRSAAWVLYALPRVGVRPWGASVVGDVLTFRTRKDQARYVQYRLRAWGVHYTGGVA